MGSIRCIRLTTSTLLSWLTEPGPGEACNGLMFALLAAYSFLRFKNSPRKEAPAEPKKVGSSQWWLGLQWGTANDHQPINLRKVVPPPEIQLLPGAARLQTL